jgi:hypothetical protein
MALQIIAPQTVQRLLSGPRIGILFVLLFGSKWRFLSQPLVAQCERQMELQIYCGVISWASVGVSLSLSRIKGLVSSALVRGPVIALVVASRVAAQGWPSPCARHCPPEAIGDGRWNQESQRNRLWKPDIYPGHLPGLRTLAGLLVENFVGTEFVKLFIVYAGRAAGRRGGSFVSPLTPRCPPNQRHAQGPCGH